LILDRRKSKASRSVTISLNRTFLGLDRAFWSSFLRCVKTLFPLPTNTEAAERRLRTLSPKLLGGICSYCTRQDPDCQQFHLPDLDNLCHRPLAALVVWYGASDAVRTCLGKSVLNDEHRPFALFVAKESVTLCRDELADLVLKVPLHVGNRAIFFCWGIAGSYNTRGCSGETAPDYAVTCQP